MTGSGTAAMKLGLIGAARPGRSVLVLPNGVYGDWLARMAEMTERNVHSLHGSWTEPIDPARVRTALAEHPDVDAVSCVLHETATGLVNPVGAIAIEVAVHGTIVVLERSPAPRSRRWTTGTAMCRSSAARPKGGSTASRA